MTREAIQEYYDQHMQMIAARSESYGDFHESQFVEEMCDFLVDQSILSEYSLSQYKNTKQGLKIDAWSYDSTRHELVLISVDYIFGESVEYIGNERVLNAVKRVERFYHRSVGGNTIDIDESTEAYGLVKYICDHSSSFERIKIILLTNASFKESVKSIDRDINSKITSYDLWDISRRARIEVSKSAREDVVINLSEYCHGGVQFLAANTDSKHCQSYLLVLRGDLLAKIYDKYGERLLEQNVRTFLQFKGNVNKEIKNTIKNRPEMFFAYNNGLAVTAEHFTLNDKGDRIVTVTNMQIVNGAQTTASIFMTSFTDSATVQLERIHVPVKMTVIQDDLVEEIVPEISRCANTQNKVNAADFFSNHQYHKRIEEFSRRILAPKKNDSMKETYWFYERTRGQYVNKQSKMGKKEKDVFLRMYPKSQVITKTDIAKYEVTFDCKPHYVSKGAQWNFAKFAENVAGSESGVDGLWANDANVNELYYKHLISRTIIFRSLDRALGRQIWYSGYKANIVTYTLAKLQHDIECLDMSFNYDQIWSIQDVSAKMLSGMLLVAKEVADVITDTNENVTQYCKKETTWNRVKSQTIPLPESISSELLSRNSMIDSIRDAKKTQKIDNYLTAEIEVFNRGDKYWRKLVNWATNEKCFTETEMGILRATLGLPKKFPSSKQSKIILELEKEAKKIGFSGNV